MKWNRIAATSPKLGQLFRIVENDSTVCCCFGFWWWCWVDVVWWTSVCLCMFVQCTDNAIIIEHFKWNDKQKKEIKSNYDSQCK